MRHATLLVITALLAVAACGDDADQGGDTTASTGAATTTAADATTTEAAAPSSAEPATSGAAALDDPDAAAAAEAWTTVFDSSLGFDAKAAHLADAEALRTTVDAYTPAGEVVGGIALVPTAVVVDGDTAAITYDVTFAGQVAYSDQEGTVERVDDAWIVSRDEFCSFMSAARNPCPA
jgi:hypothetical protein